MILNTKISPIEVKKLFTISLVLEMARMITRNCEMDLCMFYDVGNWVKIFRGEMTYVMEKVYISYLLFSCFKKRFS